MARDLFLQERRDHVLALLERQGRVSVVGLSKQLDVSQATIRSDLDALAAQNLLTRTHGGAIAADRSRLELVFDVRRRLHAVQKERIATAAAAMVADGDAILLDASTTALALANQIKERRELTVLTNGLLIALALLGAPGITILMPGGFVRRDSASLVGIEGCELIRKYHFQKGFFGAKGLTFEEGLTDVNDVEVVIKKDMVTYARQVIAIVDSSKWGQVSFASFAPIERLNCVITDQDAPPDMVTALRQAGIAVVITPSDAPPETKGAR